MAHLDFEYESRTFRFHHSNAKDHIFQQMKHGQIFYEIDLLETLRKFIAPGDIVLDIGANIGTHSIFFAGVCKANVLAFEPNPVAFELLTQNISNNDLSNDVTCHQLGLGAVVGRAASTQDVLDNLGASPLVEGAGPIEVSTLDALEVKGAPRLIKIDVEGMEEDVLIGGMNLIRSAKPIVVAEVTTEAKLARMRRLLEPIGYYSADSLNYTPTIVFHHVGDVSTPERTFETVTRFLPRLNQLRQNLFDDLSRTRSSFNTIREEQTKVLADLTASLDRLPSATETQQEVTTAIGKVSIGIDNIASRLEAAEQDRNARLAQHFDRIQSSIQSIRDDLASFDESPSLSEQTIRQTEALIAAIEHTRTSAIDQMQEQISSLESNVLGVMAALSTEAASSSSAAFSEIKTEIAQTEESIAKVGTTLTDTFARLEAANSRISESVQAHTDRIETRLVDHVSRVTGDQMHRTDQLARSLDETMSRMTNLMGAATARQALTRRDEPTEQFERTPLKGICFFSHSFESGWSTWRQDQKVKLHEHGLLSVAEQHTSTPGIKSGPLDMPGPGLYQVDIALASPVSASAGWFIRIKDAASDELLGPDTPLTGASSLVRFYTPKRIVAARICVLTRQPEPGRSIQLRQVTLAKLDEETVYEEHQESSQDPVIASLASIPSRRDMLFDAVHSLLPQCDEVRVFLNEYPDIPDFLDHPRISVRRSQDFDDVGDAGKFAWIEDNDPPGYRIICDDDLLYSPDVVRKLVAATKEKNDQVLVGLHGVLVRQPVSQYYSPEGRHAIHFESALAQSKPVHILATCIMCGHSSCLPKKRSTFMFRNMADIWLMRHAQENDIPLMVLDRPRFWVRENTQNAQYNTIYGNSITQSGNSFDSSKIQDCVLKDSQPFSLQSTEKPVALAVVIATHLDRLKRCLENLHRTRGRSHELKVILVLVNADDDLRHSVKSMPFWFEIHLVDVDSEELAWNTIQQLSTKIPYDVGIRIDDHTEFAGSGWLPECVRILERSQVDFLAYSQDETGEWQALDKGGPAHFALFKTLIPDPGRLQADEQERSTVARYLETALVRDGRSQTVALRPVLSPKPQVTRSPKQTRPTIQNYFDRCVVLNLDRRQDRWRDVSAQLERFGISAVRHRATDGLWPDLQAEYRGYAASPLRKTSAAVPQLETEKQFYLDAISEAQRVAYLERKNARKAIASPGAWGYLRSLIEVLENAISDNVQQLLFLDDDVLFHKQSAAIFETAISELPENWKILQLGTLQYNWSPEWIRWRSPNLYSQRGSAVGSHAIGLHRSILPFLLDHAKRMEMPFDIGPLSAAVRCFPDENFVIYPNIAIQHLSDSDIGTSDFNLTTELHVTHRQYRWNTPDYHQTADRHPSLNKAGKSFAQALRKKLKSI